MLREIECVTRALVGPICMLCGAYVISSSDGSHQFLISLPVRTTRSSQRSDEPFEECVAGASLIRKAHRPILLDDHLVGHQ